MGDRLPCRLNLETLEFDFAEERFQFHVLGTCSAKLFTKLGKWSAIVLEPLVEEPSGILLESDAHFIFLSHATYASVTSAGPTRQFILLRKSEILAVRERGPDVDLLCLILSEASELPSRKAILELRKLTGFTRSPFFSVAATVPTVKDADARFPLDLPEPWLRDPRWFWAVFVGDFVAMFLVNAIATGVYHSSGGLWVPISVFGFIGTMIGLIIAVIALESRADDLVAKRLKGQEVEKLEEFCKDPTPYLERFQKNAARRGIRLDGTLATTLVLPDLERLIPEGAPWTHLRLRYAAYLGEVLRRELGHRIHGEWTYREPELTLRFPDVGLVVNVLGLADERLLRREQASPAAKLAEWRNQLCLVQSAQPFELFSILGFPLGEIVETVKVLEGLESRAKSTQAEKVKRRFGTYRVWKLPLGNGLSLQYIALVGDGPISPLEPRSFIPIWESDGRTPCVLGGMIETPTNVEGIALADFGGTVGRPIAAPILITNYIKLKESRFGAGQAVAMAIGSIGIKGEFLSPGSSQNGDSDQGYGSVQPLSLANPESPAVRVTGVVERVGKVTFAHSKESFLTLDLRVQRALIPLIIPIARARGTPKPGNAFHGEIWLQGAIIEDEKETQNPGFA